MKYLGPRTEDSSYYLNWAVPISYGLTDCHSQALRQEVLGCPSNLHSQVGSGLICSFCLPSVMTLFFEDALYCHECISPTHQKGFPCLVSKVVFSALCQHEQRNAICLQNAIVERPRLLWSLVASIHSHFILGCWTTCPFQKELSFLQPSHDSLCKAHFRPCLCLLYTCKNHFHWL